MIAFVIAGLDSGSVAAIIATILVLDIAVQGHNILVQTTMFQVDPAARSRINTAYVTNNFVCGAIGSGLAGLLWTHGGWTAISIAGAVLSAVAFTVWLIGRRGALAPVERVTD